MVDASLSFLLSQAFSGGASSCIEQSRGVIQDSLSDIQVISIRSTTLAKFHNVAWRARHPLLEASCIFTSRQYRFQDLTLSQFLGVMPSNPVSWMEDGLKQLGFSVPSIEVTSVSSTGASLTGVNTIPSASHSCWLGSG